MPWRELFELIIVSARKPEFFRRRQAVFALASDDGLLRACPTGIRTAGVYVGGDAAQVEAYLGVGGEDILYVGDHIYVDVHESKDVLRWRTALILRELEEELAAIGGFAENAAAARGADGGEGAARVRAVAGAAGAAAPPERRPGVGGRERTEAARRRSPRSARA